MANSGMSSIPPSAPSIVPTDDKPMLGIMLMAGFCVLAPLGDSIAKILGATVPLYQLLLVRFGLQAVLLAPVVYFAGQSLRMKRRVGWLMVLRTTLHIIGVGAMFLSLRYLPLADAIAIAFVMPFILLLLGKFVLNETVGTHRIAACVVGFIGTLLVIQPSFARVGYPALLPLVVALDFALFILVTRQIAKDVDAIALQFVSGVVATIGLAFIYGVTSISGLIDIPMVQPANFEILLLLIIGVLGTVAHLMMTWSLRFAPTATLAPMQYLEIPVATVIGFLIFGDLPNGLASLGIGITICAGLYIVRREHLTAKAISNRITNE